MNEDLQLAQELTNDYQFTKALKSIGWKHNTNQEPMLIRRIKHRSTNRTRGYVVSFVKNNMLFVGYSLWDGKEWQGVKFDQEMGRMLAVKRAAPITKLDLEEIPWSAREPVSRMVGQAIKYFKQVDVPSLFEEIPPTKTSTSQLIYKY